MIQRRRKSHSQTCNQLATDTISRQAAIEAPNRSENPNSSDYISRQEAIDALREELKKSPTTAIRAMSAIKILPSAQPEIIRCKDCKHYKAYEDTGRLACHYVIGGTVVRNLDDFCSRAERREE